MNNKELYMLCRHQDIPDRALLRLHKDIQIIWEANDKEYSYSYKKWFPMNIDAEKVSVKVAGERKYPMRFISATNELMLPTFFSKQRRFDSILKASWFKNSCYWHSNREIAIRVAFIWIDKGVLEITIEGKDFSVPLDTPAIYKRGNL